MTEPAITPAPLSDEARWRLVLGGAAPSVARWLGDIRKYFPGTVVQELAVRAGRRTLHSHPAAGAAHVFHSLLEQILNQAIAVARRQVMFK